MAVGVPCGVEVVVASGAWVGRRVALAFAPGATCVTDTGSGVRVRAEAVPVWRMGTLWRASDSWQAARARRARAIGMRARGAGLRDMGVLFTGGVLSASNGGCNTGRSLVYTECGLRTYNLPVR